jgi:hypothetical protein
MEASTFSGTVFLGVFAYSNTAYTVKPYIMAQTDPDLKYALPSSITIWDPTWQLNLTKVQPESWCILPVVRKALILEIVL